MADIPAAKQRNSSMKSWRLVVRNLPFNTTVEELQTVFGKYGEISEINLPKCRDPRYPKSCAGFCFVQYAKRKSAEHALQNVASSPFKERTLTAAYALNKDDFVTKQVAKSGNETAKMANKLEAILKGETSGSKKKLNKGKKLAVKKEIKGEVTSDEDEPVEDQLSTTVKTETDDEFEASMNDSSAMEVDSKPPKFISESEEENDEESEADSVSERKKKRKATEKKAPRKEDAAVLEGRVVFVRNLDFNATAEALKEVAEKFGEVSLAIRCTYPGTDQPTGTAFVHFREKSSADAFLNELLKPEGVEVNGRQLHGNRAVPRSTAVAEFSARKKKEPKDKRNLQLLRASVIREGTSEANGMSESDAQLRKRLILAAKAKLKDLTKFVSPTRLSIHNIPFTLNDDKLRAICFAAAKNQNAKVVESRIMRDSLGRDEKGHVKLGRSKGFGFVAFSEHADALACLRTLNNNPKTFTSDRRPIVEFSIENLNALRAKEHRAQGLKQRQQQEKDDSSNSKQISNKKKLEQKKPSSFTPTNSLNDPSALVETKRELMSGGRKWLPKRLGQKVRHRDLKEGKKPANSQRKGGAFKSKKNVTSKKNVINKRPRK